MQPTKEQILRIAEYMDYVPLYEGSNTYQNYVNADTTTVHWLIELYTTNLTELNKVWANVYEETKSKPKS